MSRARQIGLISGWLAFGVRLSFGAPQVFFTSQESVEAEVVRLIEHSQSSIDMALFELRSTRLAGTLARAKERGVRVRLILDAEHAKEDLPAGEVRVLGGKKLGRHGVMHHKFALFDRRQVVTGSFNWTPGAEYSNYENALLLDDSKTVSAYDKEFETLWQRAQPGVLPTGVAAASHRAGRSGRRGTESRLKTIRIRKGTPVKKIRHKKKT